MMQGTVRLVANLAGYLFEGRNDFEGFAGGFAVASPQLHLVAGNPAGTQGNARFCREIFHPEGQVFDEFRAHAGVPGRQGGDLEQLLGDDLVLSLGGDHLTVRDLLEHPRQSGQSRFGVAGLEGIPHEFQADGDFRFVQAVFVSQRRQFLQAVQALWTQGVTQGSFQIIANLRGENLGIHSRNETVGLKNAHQHPFLHIHEFPSPVYWCVTRARAASPGMVSLTGIGKGEPVEHNVFR